MTTNTRNKFKNQFDCPSRKIIEQEKQQQDAAILALRQMLAKVPHIEEMTLYGTAM